MKYLKRGLVCLGVALFCAVFYRIYDLFSHGVQSFFMTFLFLPPLIDGCIQLFFAFLCKNRFSRLADNLFHAGTAAVTVGFLLRGIFEIAGTDSPYLAVFFAVGSFLLLLSLIFFLIPQRKGTVE